LCGPTPAQTEPAAPEDAVCEASGSQDAPARQEQDATDDALVCREIQAIAAAVGKPGRFVLEPSTEERAASTVHGENNVILFSKKLVDDLKQSRTRWIARLFLAHELGHHYANHPRLPVNVTEKARRELEADRFSGLALARLGASFDQTKAGFMLYDEGGINGYPSREERLAAGRTGWLAVKAPQEELTLTFAHDDGSSSTTAWRKQGTEWTATITGGLRVLFEETTRDDAYLTLARKDRQEILLVPLAGGEVFSLDPETRQRDFDAIARARWKSDPAQPFAVAAQSQDNPELGVVPVHCKEKGAAGFACASPQEKVAIRDVVQGRWHHDAGVIYPSGWLARPGPANAHTSILPGSATLLARHNFKVTVRLPSPGGITHAQLKARRAAGEDVAAYDANLPLAPPDKVAAAPAGEDVAAAIGVEAAAQPDSAAILAERRSKQAPGDGNYVALRYIVFQGGPPCPDPGTDAAHCGKPAEAEGYVPIEARPDGWSATVAYHLLDEATARPDDPLQTVQLTCRARRSLSIEAFSAACETVWEAMTRVASWSGSTISSEEPRQ
jgi:hypothetical protein